MVHQKISLNCWKNTKRKDYCDDKSQVNNILTICFFITNNALIKIKTNAENGTEYQKIRRFKK